MANDLSAVPAEVLASRLKTLQTIQRTVMAIFAIIVLAWIVLGYWKTNLPIFISTVAMAVAISALVSMMPRMISAELKRRETGQ